MSKNIVWRKTLNLLYNDSMIEHPVPRQITTFEFKLIGELTIKQFGFLLFGSIGAIVLYFLVPGFAFLNIIVAAVPALLGIGFAFFPINERPMDIWLKNLINRLLSPTQYYFKKNNRPPKILMGVVLPPRDISKQHLLAQQKLNDYLQSKQKTTPAELSQKATTDEKRKEQAMKELIFTVNQTNSVSKPLPSEIPTPLRPPSSGQAVNPASPSEFRTNTSPSTSNNQPIVIDQPLSPPPVSPTSNIQHQTSPSPLPPQPVINHFTLSGTVYTANGVPLSGILLYLRKGTNTVRLFKTLVNGSFTNNLPIEKDEYTLEVIDPKNKYAFDRMKIDGNQTKLEIYASNKSI
jgi:hypothetical protein